MSRRPPCLVEVENVELELLLQGLERARGIDLQGHSMDSVRRKVWEAVRREKARTVSGLQEKLLHDPAALQRFVRSLAGKPRPYSAGFFSTFRRDLVPLLKTYPFIRLWQAGCVSSFETHLLGIILLEEGVQEKANIYATDRDEAQLRRTQDGLFPMSELESYREIHAQSGGKRDLLDYCCTGEESGLFDPMLRRNMVFAQHHFATDGSFNEFNAILSRDSLSVLDRPIQERAHRMFYDSLVLFGILGLTEGESPGEERFAPLDQEQNLYRKIA